MFIISPPVISGHLCSFGQNELITPRIEFPICPHKFRPALNSSNTRSQSTTLGTTTPNHPAQQLAASRGTDQTQNQQKLQE